MKHLVYFQYLRLPYCSPFCRAILFIKFSYDMMGYPDYVTIKIFPNDLCRILHKGDYSVIYKAEYGANNKKDNVYNKIPSYGILYFKTIDMEIIRSFDMYAGK